MSRKPANLLTELYQTAGGWVRHRASQGSAALAFYTLFSLAPVLYFAIGIAGAVLDPAYVRGELFQELGALVGEDGALFLSGVLDAAMEQPGGWFQQLLGVGTLVFGATAVFVQLQDSLNAAWEVKPQPGPLVAALLRKRIVSLALVLIMGFLLLVSLLVSTALSAVEGYLGRRDVAPPFFLEAGNFVLSLLIVGLLIAAIYRILPDAVIGWRDVALGASLTAFLFVVGKSLIGFYLGRSGLASGYGAAGSLVLVLLWVYYSSLIVLFGAEFTRVHSRRFHSRRVVPAEGAEVCDDAITPEEDSVPIFHEVGAS
ncbi:MAG: YihY/virulence factor BrkB family protein [Thermoanaerobaculia bacterium]|nr:YihY/virulence factor BrkB family protein [Thermoanaerobaculia bacterium]